MRSYILTLGLILTASAFANADQSEIQMFTSYRDAYHHDLKIVATPKNPVSAFYILPEKLINCPLRPCAKLSRTEKPLKPTTAACYWGDPYAALDLFMSMVHTFNLEYHRAILVRGQVLFSEYKHSPELHIEGFDERGREFPWFPEMARCWRESFENERWPNP